MSIRAISQLLLTLFGPNFRGSVPGTIFNRFQMFWVQNFLGTKFFGSQHFFGPKIFFDQKFFPNQNAFDPNFFQPKIFLTQNVFDHFFRTQDFFRPTFFTVFPSWTLLTLVLFDMIFAWFYLCIWKKSVRTLPHATCVVQFFLLKSFFWPKISFDTTFFCEVNFFLNPNFF